MPPFYKRIPHTARFPLACPRPFRLYLSMSNDTPSPSTSPLLQQSRAWIITEGVLFILVGLIAVSFPYFMTLVLEQFLGILLVITGVFTLGGVVFNKGEKGHRLSSLLSGLLQLVVGIVLLTHVSSGILALTTLLAIFLVLEGLFSMIAALKGRGKLDGWVWLFLNGIVALVLAFLIFQQIPNSAAWIIGLLYGINLIFSGFSFLFIGLAAKK